MPKMNHTVTTHRTGDTTSARHGMRRWEFDATFESIRLMRLVGLVKGVKLPKFTPPAASGLPKGLLV